MGDENTNLGWKTEIPEALRGNEAFSAFKGDSKDELWNGHIEAVGKVKDLEGKLANSIPKLSENPTPEEIAAYRASLGVPESSDKYELDVVPDGIPIIPSMVDWFKKASFDLGLNPNQAKTLFSGYVQGMAALVAQDRETREKARVEGMNKLYAEWGDQKDANTALIRKTIKALGSEDLLKYFNENPDNGNDPAIINFFLRVGKAMSEDTLEGKGAGGTEDKDKRPVDEKTGMPMFSYPTMKTGG